MRTYEHEILNATVSADTASEIIDCRHLTFLSLQLKATGTLDADVAIQVSNDGVNFIEISQTSQNFSGNSDGIIELVDVCCAYARAYLTFNSGSSVVTIKMVNKGIT